MRRRKFIAGIGSVAAWPLPTRAQQPAMAVVGFIHSSSPGYFSQMAPAFGQGLKETGYVDGRNVSIEYRWAEGHYERLSVLVGDLIDRTVDVIFAGGGTDPAKVAKAATNKIPIVFVSAADPVKTGLVASLNRPGGNVTGVSLLASSLDAKKLELLRDLVPQVSTIGALINPSYPEAKSQENEFQTAANLLGVRSLVLSAGTDADINTVFAGLAEQHVGALVVSTDPFFAARRDQLVALAAQHSVPVIYFSERIRGSGWPRQLRAGLC
jgi:putative ABC transport system substrate-binding protein